MVKQGLLLCKFTNVRVQYVHVTEAAQALIYPNYWQQFSSKSATLNNCLLIHLLTLKRYTQTIRRQQPANCLSVFDYFLGAGA